MSVAAIRGSSTGGGMAIGDPVTGGTNQSVLFVDSSGDLAQDNPNLTYSPSTNTLSVVDGYIRVVNGVGMGAALIGEGTPTADFVGIARISGGSFAGWLLNYDTSTGIYQFGSNLIQDSSGNIGIGTTPSALFHVHGSGVIRKSNSTNSFTIGGSSASQTTDNVEIKDLVSSGGYSQLGLWGASSSTNVYFVIRRGTNTSRFFYGQDSGGLGRINNEAGATVIYQGNFPGTEVARFGTNGNIFNETGINLDFRVEGDTDQNLIFVDASTDRVGIGTATPGYKLDVNGNGNFNGSVNIETVNIQAGIISETSSSLTVQSADFNFYDAPSGHEFLQDVVVPDEAYGVGWNGSLEVPTKNAIYDKIESLSPGGGGNSVTATVAFGASFTDKAQTVVTGESWVTLTSNIIPQVLTPSGTDPDEMRLLDFKPVISDLVAGDGFTITLYSEPEAKGDYSVMCIGA